MSLVQTRRCRANRRVVLRTILPLCILGILIVLSLFVSASTELSVEILFSASNLFRRFVRDGNLSMIYDRRLLLP
jgi:hypothetical protein